MSGNFEMDRRNLARTAVLGVAAVAALPLRAKAQTAMSEENIIFTADHPGHWDAVKKTHAPIATVSGSTLTVKTPHPMKPEHFIVSHSVVLEGGKYLGRKTFTPADMPESTYTLPDGYKGKVTVTSTCNLHDFWVSNISV